MEELDGAGTEWPEALIAQVHKLDSSYPGGLKGYVRNAKALLEAASSGANPLEGVVAAEVPSSMCGLLAVSYYACNWHQRFALVLRWLRP